MTSEDIRTALKDALEPVASSVKEMSGKFEKFQLTTTSQLAEIRTDMKHLRRGHTDLAASVEKVREDHAECVARTNWPLVESLIRRDEDTQTVKLQAAERPTDKQSNGQLRFSLPKGAAKWLGWLIAAALLGAALAGAAILGRDSGLQEGVQEATKYFTSNPPQPADDKQEARP